MANAIITSLCPAEASVQDRPWSDGRCYCHTSMSCRGICARRALKCCLLFSAHPFVSCKASVQVSLWKDASWFHHINLCPVEASVQNGLWSDAQCFRSIHVWRVEAAVQDRLWRDAQRFCHIHLCPEELSVQDRLWRDACWVLPHPSVSC